MLRVAIQKNVEEFRDRALDMNSFRSCCEFDSAKEAQLYGPQSIVEHYSSFRFYLPPHQQQFVAGLIPLQTDPRKTTNTKFFHLHDLNTIPMLTALNALLPYSPDFETTFCIRLFVQCIDPGLYTSEPDLQYVFQRQENFYSFYPEIRDHCTLWGVLKTDLVWSF
jgi:hypothetical protein